MKGLKTRLAIILSALSLSLPLSSCNFIFGGDSGYAIQDVETTTNADGSVTMTITYSDEEIDPLVLTLPAGMAGKDGVTIDSVTSETDEETGNLIITITYSDPEVENTVLSIPVLAGEDGKGIASVDLTVDEDTGNTILTFTYTDETTSEVEIPKARDGIDGIGIEAITYQEDENGNTIITITYTSDEMEDTIITVPAPLDGAGVIEIRYSPTQSTDEEIALIVSFSDGTDSVIRFPRPTSTTWHNGSGSPNAATGSDGDYYLDISTGDVYQKSEGSWGSPLFSMQGTGASEEITYCTIMFDANGGLFEDDTTSKTLQRIQNGTRVSLDTLTNEIGTPVMQGYTFTGFYTHRTDEIYAGKFTDLTEVYGTALTLYAHYELN